MKEMVTLMVTTSRTECFNLGSKRRDRDMLSLNAITAHIRKLYPKHASITIINPHLGGAGKIGPQRLAAIVQWFRRV